MNALSHINNQASLPVMFSSMAKPLLQAKLTVNTPGDIYEQEADAMADRVMLMSSNETAKPVTGLIGKSLQRKCAHCAEEEKRRKPIMRKAEAGNAGMSVSSSFASSLNASKGGGAPLPPGTRGFMENAFSTDFSGVKIHSDSQASEMSKGINAKAFTHGNDIYFNDGEYNPNTQIGAHLLAHELTHTMQQSFQTTSPVRRDLSAPPREPADAIVGLNGEQVDMAIAYNQAHLRDPYSGVLLRDVMGGGIDQTSSAIDEEFVTALAEWQAEHHLTQDGMAGHTTIRSLFIELVAERQYKDAIVLIIDFYNLPMNSHLQDIIVSRNGPTACNVDGSPSDATVSGGICPPNVGRPINLIVCLTSIPTGVNGYDHFVRIIGHELVHLIYCSSGVAYNNVETEFDAYAWEACSNNGPHLANAARVNHANMALGFFVNIPAASQTPARISMRDRLNNLITDGGAGNCHN